MFKYFSDSDRSTIETLRKAYKRNALKMHPDKGGSHSEFTQMSNEYNTILEKRLFATEESFSNDSVKMEKDLAQKINDIMSATGIEIEVSGSWIWVGGNTFESKDILKNAGFRFAGKKKMWYWSATMNEKRRGRLSVEARRKKYGSVKIETKTRKVLA